jgi:dolichol-phosphate mannosyltransferase
MTPPLRLSVVMLAYNEADNLGPVVAESVAALAASESISEFQLVIVDDGSTDGTPDVVAGLMATHSCLVSLVHKQNRGMGAAVKTGYAGSELEYVTFIPADGQVPIVEILKLVPAARDGADMVLGNYTQRGEVDGGARMFLSKGLRLLMAGMLGTTREISGIVLFRRVLLDRLPIKSESFFANLELPVRAIRAGLDVRDVAIEVHPRRSGASKVANMNRIRRVATELVRFRLNLAAEALGRK